MEIFGMVIDPWYVLIGFCIGAVCTILILTALGGYKND